MTIDGSYDEPEILPSRSPSICLIGADGEHAVLPPELDGANLTQGTARIAPSRQIEKHFLLWQIRSAHRQGWIKQQIKGTTFLEITLARLREMPIFIPPSLFRIGAPS